MPRSGGTQDGIDAKPGKREIEAQLKRLLESARFVNSPSQAATLEVIVGGYLEENGLSDKAIGGKAFPGFIAGRSTDVRVGVFNLRKTLKEYYEQDGRNDSVIIGIRKGRKYQIVASYNPKSKAVVHYQNALEAMSDAACFPWHISDALANCQLAIESDPEFTAAYGLLAEFCLCFGIVRLGEINEYGLDAPPHGGLEREIYLALRCAIKAVRMDRKCWRGYVAFGIILCLIKRWKNGARMFSRAEKVAPEEIRGDPWYLVYLVAVGRDSEALSVVDDRLASCSPRSFWKVVGSLVCYVLGAKGRDIELSGREMEFTYSAIAVIGLNFLENQRANDAANIFRWLFDNRKLSGEFNPIGSMGLWGLFEGLAGNAETTKEIIDWLHLPPGVIEKRRPFRDVPYPSLIRSELTYQFGMRFLFEGDETVLGERWLRDPWEVALAHLGLGQTQKAMRYLRLCILSQHPMCLWLHRWPFLANLHRDGGFIDLVRDMRLPAEALPGTLNAIG
jgi:hypothetical protein